MGKAPTPILEAEAARKCGKSTPKESINLVNRLEGLWLNLMLPLEVLYVDGLDFG